MALFLFIAHFLIEDFNVFFLMFVCGGNGDSFNLFLLLGRHLLFKKTVGMPSKLSNGEIIKIFGRKVKLCPLLRLTEIPNGIRSQSTLQVPELRVSSSQI